MSKHQLDEGAALIVIHPSGPSDSLSISISQNDTTKGLVILNPQQAAHFIQDLRQAFNGFHQPSE